MIKSPLRFSIKWNNFFSNCDVIAISDELINMAIKLRQQKSMSVCDALIAATSLEEGLRLVTANVRDFKHINNLDLFNPIDL
ncbi:type II toxin-antitoxin system VapC family toxin [Cryomorpha ignava]|uniref:Type II toxin-antitoxin system VapC family toxin n=2 Tax=Cryomorpha ignava TaxID=101383 RepID=A0A7K3WSZ6_9FLAO|nr:type II toxin-antitoxin system VapC family toxin [Cryomorpha ignava]